MRRRTIGGARTCYRCDAGVPIAARCHVCGSNAFYRRTHPRRQTVAALMGLSEAEAPPTDVSYGTPVRRRGYRGAGPQ